MNDKELDCKESLCVPPDEDKAASGRLLIKLVTLAIVCTLIWLVVGDY